MLITTLAYYKCLNQQFLVNNAKYKNRSYIQNNIINHRLKKIFFEVGVFKQGDVLKQMFQKGYKISFRMYLNLCDAKFSRIDVENRVYGEVILSLHFSIAFSNMCHIHFD